MSKHHITIRRATAFSSAELCRERGWRVGTILKGTETCGEHSHTDRIIITAIGEERILARHLPHGEDEESGDEHSWTLELRDWQEAME